MSPRKKSNQSGALLELWRPPKGAGDPVGCLSTTYTFHPGVYDEQCLARFLDIESEPNREDLSFLLERESRLGSVYAGVLVDYTQAGVEHSLRWDVLPVRIPGAKQHAKLSLLLWSRHARVIVTSANLTEQGYRYNYEAAACVEATPSGGNVDGVRDAVSFLQALTGFVPGSSEQPAVVQRAREFLAAARSRVGGWTGDRRGGDVRQRLVFTVPARPGQAPRSSFDETLDECRKRGGSPFELWVASPFYDSDKTAASTMATVAKSLSRQRARRIDLGIPALRDKDVQHARLLAPKTLFDTASRYVDTLNVEMLPVKDGDGNVRPWHAKLLLLRGEGYVGLLTGSANFTGAALGLGPRRNAEAGVLTLLDRSDVAPFEELWPGMEMVADAGNAEWLGISEENDEEESASQRPVPPGFLVVTFRAGFPRVIELQVDGSELPDAWVVIAGGANKAVVVFSSDDWVAAGKPSQVACPWDNPEAPERLTVQWNGFHAFLPVNVDDQQKLPAPSQLQHMTADDMLGILAASDPGAAFRLWARAQQTNEAYDPDFDSAEPIDLDPLRMFDLQKTFLHRVRRRARVLAAVRANLQRPATGKQGVEWKLRGLVGIEPLACRLLKEFIAADTRADEALLTLADFLITLADVRYETAEGALPRSEFEAIYHPFLRALSNQLSTDVVASGVGVSADVAQFWKRVVQRCQA